MIESKEWKPKPHVQIHHAVNTFISTVKLDIYLWGQQRLTHFWRQFLEDIRGIAHARTPAMVTV